MKRCRAHDWQESHPLAVRQVRRCRRCPASQHRRALHVETDKTGRLLAVAEWGPWSKGEW